ncbi:MAG: glycosyltransferase family 2 protein [Candidatus Altiarchaeota archaeon]
MSSKISVIIPAYNEEESVGETIKRIQEVNSEYEIIVVDDGSRDKTIEIAKNSGAKVFKFKKNQGKGAAFRKGIQESSGDIIVQIDADSQFLPEEIPKLIKPLIEGEADITFGSRFLPDSSVEKGSLSFRNRIANIVDSFLASFFSGIKITDVQAGFKAFTRDALDKINFQENSFAYEPEIAILAGKRKLRVKEVPVSYKVRKGGKSNIKFLRDIYLIIKTMIKTWLLR